MRDTKYLAVILIVIGVFGLLINSNVLSMVYWNIVWPIGIILLGIAAFVYLRDNPNLTSANLVEKVVGGLVVAGVLMLVFLAVFGIIGPILALVAVIIAAVVLFKLGIAILAVVIPLAVIISPIILIVWLLLLLL
ncbi:MAG: hypothetical protein WAP20_01575 [Limnochordia bacterium]|nr:hypothetical protein [Bacillota bacterium]HOB09625.1 hypothetical protein [Limnochordia bacterium]NLH31780.1 hypothetical protein [Bacillota bacterium]HPZ31541.1 hypothetical protein [Limnochordia bacterium]HQD71331.1 hypothetical protein [Limnochordia bacterium]